MGHTDVRVMRKIPIQVKLTGDLLDRLDARKAVTGMDRTALSVEACEAYLASVRVVVEKPASVPVAKLKPAAEMVERPVVVPKSKLDAIPMPEWQRKMFEETRRKVGASSEDDEKVEF